MENKKVTWKEASKGRKIFAVIFLLIFFSLFIGCVRSCNEENPQDIEITKMETKAWDSLSFEQREKYLKTVIERSPIDLMALQSVVEDGIKAECSFPKEVDIEGLNFISNIQIDDTQNGWLYAKGTGTTKNAFGVKIKFNWLARLHYQTQNHSIKELKVWE